MVQPCFQGTHWGVFFLSIAVISLVIALIVRTLVVMFRLYFRKNQPISATTHAIFVSEEFRERFALTGVLSWLLVCHNAQC